VDSPPPANSNYGPDLAPYDFHFLIPLKNELTGQHFADNRELEQACMKSFNIPAESFMQSEYSISYKA
jgi:hypothetical protein